MKGQWRYRKYFEIEHHQGQCACGCDFDKEEAELIKQYPLGLKAWKGWLAYLGYPSPAPKTFKDWIKEQV